MKLRLEIILLSIIIVLILSGYYFAYTYYIKNQNVESEVISYESKTDNFKEEKNDIDEIFVEIKGAVANPGVYSMKKNSIINDLISSSGGLNKNAYTDNINLSKNLKSQMVVYVFTKYEYLQKNKTDEKKEEKEVKQEVCNCPTYEIESCIEKGISVIENNEQNSEELIDNESNEIRKEATQNEDSNNLININTATSEELQRLPGIGEAKANKIIEYRNATGSFNTIDDIKNVSGISDNLFEKIKDLIIV